jgi:predicted restriction endonuclease
VRFARCGCSSGQRSAARSYHRPGGIRSRQSEAWTADDVEPGLRDAIIKRARQHTFTEEDFKAITRALEKLKGNSNRSAWAHFRESMPAAEWRLQLAGVGTPTLSDAIDDLGADSAAYVPFTGKRYARNPKVRMAVLQRAGGKCEYCGKAGFRCSDDTQYLECHHILALANDGADRMTNVIAVCPGDHREAHFGKRRAAIEKQMITKVKVAELGRLGSARISDHAPH